MPQALSQFLFSVSPFTSATYMLRQTNASQGGEAASH